MRGDRWFPKAVLAALVLWAPALAFASVGRVEVVEGSAWRTPEGAERQPLAVGTELEQKDTLDVGPKSGVKLVLNDGSVLMLSADSQLVITEAAFEGQERKGFTGSLNLGRVWADVKKMLSGSEAKFEVKTDRAVAGVRGTRLRVDVAPPVTLGALSPKTVVLVYTGQVQVVARVSPKAAAPDKAPPKGERVEVPGPREIPVEEWEKRFIELKENQRVEVGDVVGDPKPIPKKQRRDAFDDFVNRNQGPKKP